MTLVYTFRFQVWANDMCEVDGGGGSAVCSRV